jgi:hypothetical protein
MSRGLLCDESGIATFKVLKEADEIVGSECDIVSSAVVDGKEGKALTVRFDPEGSDC